MTFFNCLYRYLGQSGIKEKDDKEDTEGKSRGRARPKRRRSKRKTTPQPEKFDDIGVDEDKEETPRTPRETGNVLDRQRTFSIPHRNSQSSFTTLPSLDRRESVYFQIAAATPGDVSSDSSDDENEPTLETKSKDLSTRRRSSFVAWVQENGVDQKKKLLDRLKHVQLKDSPLEQRRNSFANFIQRYKSTRKSVTPADQLQDISEDVNPDNNEVFRGLNNSYPTDNHTDVMKSIMLNKPERRRKIVEPLNNRIDSFYSRIDHLKVPVFEFNSPAPKLTALERRRYTLLTKGINAALALGDSSDEEH